MRRRILLNTSSGGDGRGTIGGYEVVDLGLPSGLLWATCNVRTNSETSYGNYYMYGLGSRNYHSSDSMYTGTENPLSPYADTAILVMGSGWRMPTKAEFQELIANTNYEWVINFNGSGVNGGKFTSKTNPNAYVFFPAAGFYSNGSFIGEGVQGSVWTSTPYDINYAYGFSLLYANSQISNSANRKLGFSVRGVHAAV